MRQRITEILSLKYMVVKLASLYSTVTVNNVSTYVFNVTARDGFQHGAMQYLFSENIIHYDPGSY